ncbi:hypothetical protein GN157_13005 [Flavobacterium rakeshii]|uniref:Uncharacterized protein n=1 Tax=Flavobacterium rakeshii TaxID=1038845 RepID=A0A6N8HFX9_9FLAO|nr:DUF6252 family protein [Flavobacterium rakeshii]MUV04629.1 hypothetical protein [Flavobacterium rakeshii]
MKQVLHLPFSTISLPSNQNFRILGQSLTQYFVTKLICLFSLLFLLFACDTDDNNDDSLPEATTTGAGTFACRVDGKSFIDPGSTFNCFYQYIDGIYHFGIGGEDEDYKDSNRPWSLYLLSENVELEQGQTYQLLTENSGNVVGMAFFSYSPNENYLQQTDLEYTGELTITRLGTGNDPHILSGTFWFDVVHPLTSETVHITDGRFDTMYLE